MNEDNANPLRPVSFARYWRSLIVAAALIFAGGGAVMLSAKPLPPVETDPAVIAAALKSCDAGDYENCYIYGRAMSAKSTSQDDLNRAFAFIEKACNGGVVNACFGAGRRHASGLGVKVDLKKARDFEQRGCNGGDERACAVLKRLDTPPPSAASLTGLPPTLQSNVNAAVYFEPNGADLLSKYADHPSFDKDPKMKWNLKAAACEMGNWKACQNAALAFTEVQGFNGEGKKDLPRAIRMAKIGCDGNDALSCHILGLVLTGSNNNVVTSGAQAAYEKAYPQFQKLCEAGNGFYCDAIAYYHEGIAFPYDGAKAKYYYQKGCNVGFQKACQGYAKLIDTNRQLASQDAARRQQQAREDKYMLFMWGSAPKDPATVKQCLAAKSDFNAEINSFNRSGETLVQGVDAANVRGKRMDYIERSEQSCVKMLDIAERAGNAGCYGAGYRDMMEQIPKFQGVSTSGGCYHRSIEMGANWNTNR
ncbi:MAG: hypothetical protein WBL74_05740 [Novosphingobium sp.]|uniref:tetratricopeptide repeat protein n=1 Tax=Novosphingobium sp. TaxID=1874826 RepID=UPI003C7BA226